ncbi:DrmB family protein [Propioniciclava flava]|uniref:MrfA-like Zn-binding domain-containing protein n=1 Tax=Propioniciclava flava TaxID=2072026 RepID=A0A4V1Q7J0_9ACTN|nr:DrmB family protein [Propioniciclava flava]RXW32758.1 hypothetical protein C1706_06350 [Propioniciclava flava]
MADLVSGDHSLDPLGDAEALKKAGIKKNYAKVGSGRPSTLLFTYGPGAIMDLPRFTVMPSGLDAWDRIWKRRDGVPYIHAPKLLAAVRRQLGQQVTELRPFPHQPAESSFSDEGRDLGLPALVFPQWLRCTGCDRLAPLSTFAYSNTNPYKPDEAKFEHVGCPGRSRTAKGGGKKRSPCVPARYLLACENGHLDEFPYLGWVHRGGTCSDASTPMLKMTENTLSRGASARIVCASCGASRGMNEAQGAAGKAKLPACRGRHPHLDAFAVGGCDAPAHLMLVGASNLWFPITQSAIVMPMDDGEKKQNLADRLKSVVGDDLPDYVGELKFLRKYLKDRLDVTEISDADLAQALTEALSPLPADPEVVPNTEWSALDLMVPEWNHLQLGTAGAHHEDEASGLVVTTRQLDPGLPKEFSRVLAVEKLRQATALLGFTRIDEWDRIDDVPTRQVPLTVNQPVWALATLNRGEGVFLQLDEKPVAAWEATVEASDLWAAHKQAHRNNYANRLSGTAANIDPDTRMPPPRYWLLHTLAHVLFRQMALSSGYGAASISERLYGWRGTEHRPPAAGLLLLTTSSDSDGTLGGLVQLSEPVRLRQLVTSALRGAQRCSSDPLCSHRTPGPKEDFLHGAACHACAMASETSCERSNRFLDRRLLIRLPGPHRHLGFFDVS